MNYIDGYHMKFLADKTPVQTCGKCGRDFYTPRPANREAHYPANQMDVPVAFAQPCDGKLIPFPANLT